jgi:CBS domain-containing protein
MRHSILATLLLLAADVNAFGLSLRRLGAIGRASSATGTADVPFDSAPPKTGLFKRARNFVIGEPLNQGPTIRTFVPLKRASSKDRNWEGAERPVSDYMNTDIVTLRPDQSLSEAGKILTENGIAGAPVVNQNGRLVGVLSRKDLLFQIAGRGSLKTVESGAARSTRYVENTRRLQKIEAEVVNTAMTPYPMSLGPSATMQEAAALMLRRNLNRVLVTHPETNCLIGIVSSTDIFRLAFEDGSTWK